MHIIGCRSKGSVGSLGYEASRDCSEHKVNNSIVLLDVVFVSLFVCLLDCLFFYSFDHEVCV
jgi:hypothetical protein